MKTTLLTGISGYIGLHCAKQLLEAGYTVRGTVRSQAKVQLVRGELWVTGACESQDSAEKIVRMVRKSCLIPVRDQLTVK